MRLLAAILFVIFVSGVYSNCGCIKCNRDLHVISPPGSPVKIIYKDSPCTCHTSLPYSVQVPAASPAPTAGRLYGYHVEEAKIPHPCAHLLQEHHFQVQVPQPSQQPTYLSGLKASTDRILLAAPVKELHPICQHPIIEPLKAELAHDFYYIPKAPRHCDCFSCKIFKSHPYIQLRSIAEDVSIPPKHIKVNESEASENNDTQSTTQGSRSKRSINYQLLALNSNKRPLFDRKNVELNNGLLKILEQIRQRRTPLFKNLNLRSTFLKQNDSIVAAPKTTIPSWSVVDKPPLRQTEYYIPNYHEHPSPTAQKVEDKRPRLFSLKNLRLKRAVRVKDESMLPFFTLSDDSDEMEEVYMPKKRDRILKQSGPPSLEEIPVFQLLHLPVKYLENLHKFKTNIDPIVGGLPKAVTISRRYFINLFKHILGDYNRLTKKNVLQKKPFQRNALIKFRNKRDLDDERRIGENHIQYQENPETISTKINNDIIKEFLKLLSRQISSEENQRKPYEYLLETKTNKEDDEKELYNLIKELDQVLPLNDPYHPLDLAFTDDDDDFEAIQRRKRQDDKSLEEVRNFLKSTEEVYEFMNKQNGHMRSKRASSSILNEIIKLIGARPAFPNLNRKQRSVSTAQKVNPPESLVKEEIIRLSTHIQNLVASDFSYNFELYTNLLELEILKKNISESWKSILDQKSSLEETQILTKLENAQLLKDQVVNDIISKLSNNSNSLTNQWIKTLIFLQKFACATKHLKRRMEHRDFETDFLSIFQNMKFTSAQNFEELLDELKTIKNYEMHSQIKLLNNLKVLLKIGNADKIKEESAIIWERNNIIKMQQESILQLNEKLAKQFRIRGELKILFDLQKQREMCEEKEKKLFKDL